MTTGLIIYIILMMLTGFVFWRIAAIRADDPYLAWAIFCANCGFWWVVFKLIGAF